jgi:hypothetical protein
MFVPARGQSPAKVTVGRVSCTSNGPLTSRPAVQEVLWTHPEWWVVALGLLAWGLVLQQDRPAGHSLHLRQSAGVEFVSWHVMVWP